MRKKPHRGLLTALVTIALVSAACGSDEDDDATPATAVSATEAPATEATSNHDGPARSSAAEEVRVDMRKLWEDHITWTRLFMVSAIAGLPDTDATAERLLRNQGDIGDAVAVYYGEDAGAQLTELLRQHILIAVDLVGAAQAGDTAAAQRQSEAWYANGDDIADFLADANPAWPAEDMRQMMRTHLDQTLAEATARLEGDWAADVAVYDRIHDHILDMADTLSAGIVEQFPDRFEE